MQNNRIKGFTLIELVCTMLILSILVVLAISSSSNLLQKNDKQTLIDQISTAVQYARIQALNSSKPVYLTPLDSSLNWSQGMALMQNPKNPDLLYQWQWHHPQWLVSWSGIHSDKIVLSNNPLTAMSNGRFDLYNYWTKEHVYLVINRLGRLKIV